MNSNDLLINVAELKKSYKVTDENRLEVLKGINLEIYKGEIAAIVGKSGAGKSTLLHILGTLDKPDSGTVSFENENIFEKKDKQLSEFRSRSIGFIFQFHHLLPEFTALENVMISSMISGISDKNKAEEALEEVGLKDRKNHKPSELSGGEAQRVAIARALINSPKLVLADEPTGNLDSENADSVIDLIFRLREKFGQTFVIVTHNEEFAGRCDRIIKLNDGIVVN
ncbi:MAG: Lipoprotein-releasing system ATP-binding protein LolD [Ignavibacteria bacterium]|nr:Lipoprotein-releasing system ATP-binding protein LolD [Ignavibacteria bacterium]